MGRTLASAALVGATGYAALQWLGRTYGTTVEDRRRRFPGATPSPDPMY